MFVLLIGALNHWVTLVVHKFGATRKMDKEEAEIEALIAELRKVRKVNRDVTKKLHKKKSFAHVKFAPPSLTKHDEELTFYLLDSSNAHFLNLPDDNIPEFVLNRAKERAASGFKPSN